MITVGLVTEGLNDQVALQELISQICSPNPVRFRFIQPSPDATSGHPHGGWTKVLAWCRRNTPDVRRQMVFGPSLTGQPPCDLLVCQLDGDVIDQYQIHAAANLPAVPWDAIKRYDFVESVLSEWLVTVEQNTVLAIPVQAMETWLAFGAHPGCAGHEDDPAEQLLLNCEPALRDPVSESLKKRGVGAEYIRLASVAAAHLGVLDARSSSFRRFHEALGAALP